MLFLIPLFFASFPLASVEEDRNALLTLLQDISLQTTSHARLEEERNPYPYNPLVAWDVWQSLEPYFLPSTHPIKPKLDRLFKKRVTLTKETFEKAGFDKIKLRNPTNIVVGKHPDLQGYLVKAYLDYQPVPVDWWNWARRITGALAIQECLHQHGFSGFCVPRKWIYPLPDPIVPDRTGFCRKNFILIVEDMHILDHEETLKGYKKKMTKQKLKALYTILTEVGLIDSVFPSNVPFTTQGKMAFIDTEHHHLQPVPYIRLKPYLSSTMQEYWQLLIDTNGNCD